jgi:hypothetical protein
MINREVPMKNKTSLLALCFVFLAFSVAHAADDDSLIQAWITSRYQGCDGGFNDVVKIGMSPFQLARLRVLEKGDCSNTGTVAVGDCLDGLNNLFNSSFSPKADTYSCQRKAVKTAAASAVTPAADLKYDADVICQPKGGSYAFTRQTGASTCHKKFDCPKDFSYLGKNFDSGTYDFSCQAHAGSCNDVSLGEGNCDNPTIQSIGWFTDGQVMKLSRPSHGAQ